VLILDAASISAPFFTSSIPVEVPLPLRQNNSFCIPRRSKDNTMADGIGCNQIIKHSPKSKFRNWVYVAFGCDSRELEVIGRYYVCDAALYICQFASWKSSRCCLVDARNVSSLEIIGITMILS